MHSHRGSCAVSVPVAFSGVHAPWYEMERGTKATAVWQREYRLIGALIHAFTFLFPLVAAAGPSRHERKSSPGKRGGETPTEGEGPNLKSVAMRGGMQVCGLNPKP